MVSTATDRRLGLNSGSAIKVPCQAVATSAITLSGEKTVGGVAVHAIGATGNPDRVLVTAGSNLNPGASSIDNGVWAVSTGPWTRDLDFDGSFDVVSGTVVPVLSSPNTSTLYALTTANPINLGSTPIAFAPQFLNQASQISYTPPGFVNAVPILSSAKMLQVVSVKDGFGAAGPALGDAAHDDTVPIQNAIDAVGGGIAYLPQPSSRYLISASLNLTVGGSTLQGQNRQTFLHQATHNVDFISVQAGNCKIQSLGFIANAYGASQHWCINANASSDGLRIFDVGASGCFSFVNFLGVNLRMLFFDVSNLQTATGIGIQINNANATVIIDHGSIFNAAGNNAFAGIYITAGTSLQLSNLNLAKMGVPLYMIPGAAVTVGNLYAANCFFDTSSTGMIADGSAAGSQVSSIDFVGCWFNGHSMYGARLRGTVKGATFTACQFGINTLDGLLLENSGVQDVMVTGCRAFANGAHGINVGPNVNLFHLKANVCGPFTGSGGNTGNGINIQAGTGNNYEIVDNDCHGNAGTGISNSATGTTCMVANNLGNGSSQTAGITVTASPFSYTAGPSPETIYINTGTVSAVSVEGVTVYSQTNCTVRLRPKQTVIVTYTVAPGMAKTIEG